MKELHMLLVKELDVMKATYGKADAKRYEDYKQTRMDDLYKRLGNAVLKEMKDVSKTEKSKGWSNGTPQQPFRGSYNALGETNRESQPTASSARNNANRTSRPASEKQMNYPNNEPQLSGWQKRLKEPENNRASRQMLVHMRKLDKVMDSSYDSWKNQQAYERINNVDRGME